MRRCKRRIRTTHAPSVFDFSPAIGHADHALDADRVQGRRRDGAALGDGVGEVPRRPHRGHLRRRRVHRRVRVLFDDARPARSARSSASRSRSAATTGGRRCPRSASAPSIAAGMRPHEHRQSLIPARPEKPQPAIIGRTSTTAEDDLYGRDTYCLDSCAPAGWRAGSSSWPSASITASSPRAARSVAATRRRTSGSTSPARSGSTNDARPRLDAARADRERAAKGSRGRLGEGDRDELDERRPGVVVHHHQGHAEHRGPFDLVLAASAVTVELLGVR
jgi:hypothetical protein